MINELHGTMQVEITESSEYSNIDNLFVSPLKEKYIIVTLCAEPKSNVS